MNVVEQSLQNDRALPQMRCLFLTGTTYSVEVATSHPPESLLLGSPCYGARIGWPITFLLGIAIFVKSLSTTTHWVGLSRPELCLTRSSTWPGTLLSPRLYSTQSSARPGALLDLKLYEALSSTRPENLLGSELYSA